MDPTLLAPSCPQWWKEDDAERALTKHTPEQIVRELREANRLFAEDSDVAGVTRHLEVQNRRITA